MPRLNIEGHGTHDVAAGTRLVLAIRDAGVDIGHRCGGHGKCTTCRVEFVAGEPDQITEAEKEKLDGGGLDNLRLACQIVVDHDMEVRPLMLVSNQVWTDAGPEPEAQLTPEPVWVKR